jgi:membrane protease YdiL (CAAX protease family)
MTDPAHEPPTDTAAPAPQPEPFDGVRARTLVWWVGAWFIAQAFALVFGGRINLLVYTLYPVLLGWALYECDHNNIHIQDFLRRPTPGAFRRVWLVLPALSFSLACVVLVVAFLHVAPSALRDRQTEIALRSGPSSLDALITAAGMVLAAPFAEELVFRGIILHRWARKWGFVRAAIASSAAFAVLHPDPLGAFVFALIMVHLYTWSGTLAVPMVAHALNNAVVVLGILSGSSSDHEMPTAAQQAAELTKAVPGAVLLGVTGLLVLLLYFRRVPRMSQWRLPVVAARATLITPAR